MTVSSLKSETVPHDPPLVVSVKVTVAGAAAAAVYVAVFGVPPALFVKLPAAPPSVQMAAVAPPANDPPRAPVFVPWHIGPTAPPAFTVGRGFIVTTTGSDNGLGQFEVAIP